MRAGRMPGARLAGAPAGVLVGVLVGALVGALLAGCGAPGSTRPAEIEPSEVPYGLLSPAVDPLVASSEGDVPEQVATTPVYLLGEGGVLLAAPTPVEPGSSTQMAEQALSRLQAGPTDEERAAGLASALGAAVDLSLVSIDVGTARVEVRLNAGELAADQVPLALGQVVLTLTSVAGIESVQLVNDGDPVEMALPGGVLTTAPVTAADYQELAEPTG